MGSVVAETAEDLLVQTDTTQIMVDMVSLRMVIDTAREAVRQLVVSVELLNRLLVRMEVWELVEMLLREATHLLLEVVEVITVAVAVRFMAEAVVADHHTLEV